ncbi:hypothetical protein [Flammeovirga kamogawensis]|uniref:SprT family zinc-dependent metalloprotease n=1 Tax=Flammeovirga kamogawensis TaxID=373891 RepID=A0ABX8H332_9BACT|nr:hypothetical protein [Flammeovirga kamogawensis]MBB6460421.1 hypothetical protein [Flammeovirga kamogawensis]QWG10226.1 hypothetical protein KM029_21325 [Flammeovirga kamogawensis]TRX64677.1 hypothetical protein EO216_19250 [Flammeovirga kamogawensis]
MNHFLQTAYKVVFTLVILSINSCSLIDMKVAPYDLKVKYEDDRLEEIFSVHVNQFVKEAADRNVTFRNRKVTIKWGTNLADNVHGQSNTMRVVKINPKSTKLELDYLRRQLICHELFHALCQDLRKETHTSKQFIDGSRYYTSLMVASSGHNNFPSLEYTETWEAYFDELFN